MSNSYLCSYKSLFSTVVRDENENQILIKKIIIPIIQRDYAQGREVPEINRIRERFLSSLFEAIGTSTKLNLDFVYGDVDANGCFTPLDGQQRLTTLFLLHWYVSKREKIDLVECSFLQKFSYETRYSSRDFCEELVKFQPQFSGASISEQIINQYWFPLDWKNDQTISSMLIMIDAIDSKFHSSVNVWTKLVDQELITFYFLPIRNIGLTDELYIKMNSRGKPLTRFEHFKAELEHQLSLIDLNTSKRISSKIDQKWTDLLWRNRINNYIDNNFLNLFKFVCDLICYEQKQSTYGRSYDEFDLINFYFSKNSKNATSNIAFLEKCFDSFANYSGDFQSHLFADYLTIDKFDSKKTKIDTGPINIFKDCIENYMDPLASRRSRGFPFGKIILLYAFLNYLFCYDAITDDEFRERIRIINNLVQNSGDEIYSDSENRIGGNRIPSALIQTKSIICDGLILDDIGNNFNESQLKEEREKQIWRKEHVSDVLLLNLLENNELLYGQIGIVGLDDPLLFSKFNDLCKCDRDKVDCALLTFGDYSRVERGWRSQLGSSSNSSKIAWTNLFHRSGASGFDKTSNVLKMLLKSSDKFSNESLNSIIVTFLSDCESNSTYDWRYYYIKYKDFRPGRYGKYYWENSESKYKLHVIWTEKKLSENAYQPFLFVINRGALDRNESGTRLVFNDKFLYCEDDGFYLKDQLGNIISSLLIVQDKNHIDKENRITKYVNAPLI